MNATITELEFNKREYQILLLLYASYADLEFSPEEKSRIIETYGYEAYEKVISFYQKKREYQILQKICDLRTEHYPGPNGKSEVLKMLKSHFLTDGIYSKLERSQYNFLHMML